MEAIISILNEFKRGNSSFKLKECHHIEWFNKEDGK